MLGGRPAEGKGKLSFGWLSDYASPRSAVWITVAFRITGQLMMFQTDTLWLFALSLSQAGEFAFVLFGFAQVSGVVPAEGTRVLAV